MSASGDHKLPTEQHAFIATEKEKAHVTKIPVPTPNDGQAFIKVAAAGINPVDWKILWYNWTGLPLPHGLGTDVSGTIVAVGHDVKDFKVGDEVLTTTNLFTQIGTFAEYVISDTVRLAHKGSKVSHVEAGALPVAFLSAYDGFHKAKVEKGKTIFVSGGAGGVGHFIVQLAKIHGLHVISSGGKEDSLKVLKDLGVEHILNYAKDDVVEAVHKLTDGKGVDYVFDATYVPSSIENSAKVLKEGGTFIILGAANAENPAAKKLVGEKKKALGL